MTILRWRRTPTRNRSNPWLALGLDAFGLGIEAASVIALRSLTLAAGGAKAQAEAVRMVSEKAEAATALAFRAATGSLGTRPATVASKAIGHYRRKVRTNRRRLGKL